MDQNISDLSMLKLINESAKAPWSNGYGTEDRQKVMRSRPGFAIRRLEDPVNPAVNG